MSLLKKIVGQSFIYFTGTLFSVVVGFFFKVYISNILGAKGLGLFTLGMSSVAIASIFLTLGYGNGLVRFVSKYIANNNYGRLKHYIKKTVFLNLLTVVPLSMVYFLVPKFIGEHLLNSKDLVEYIPLFGVILIINSLLSIGDQIIRGLQEVKKSTVVHHFIRLPLKISITVLLFSFGFALSGYLIAEIVAAFLSVVLFVFILKSLLPKEIISLKNEINTSNAEEKKYAFNMLIIELLGVIQSHGEKIILVYFMSESELGVYSVILSIVAFIPTILISVTSIFSPIISTFHTSNQMEKLSTFFKSSVKYVFVLSFPLVAFILLFSKSILGFFGEDFTQGYILLCLVVLGEFINTSFGSVGTMLKMMGYDKLLRNISGVTSIFAFFSSFLLIDLFGLTGVGIAYILKNILYNLSASIMLYKKSKIHVFNPAYRKVIALYLFLFCITFFAYIPNNLSVMQMLLSIVLCYVLFVSCWAFVLGKKDIPQIIKLLKSDS